MKSKLRSVKKSNKSPSSSQSEKVQRALPKRPITLELDVWDWRKSESDNEATPSIEFSPQEAEMIDLAIKEERCTDAREFMRKAVLRLVSQAKTNALRGPGHKPLQLLEDAVNEAEGLLELLTVYIRDLERHDAGTAVESSHVYGMFQLSITTREKLRRSFGEVHDYALGKS